MDRLAAGDAAGAIVKLEAFINQVLGLIPNVLTSAQGDPLVADAQQTIDLLSPASKPAQLGPRPATWGEIKQSVE